MSVDGALCATAHTLDIGRLSSRCDDGGALNPDTLDMFMSGAGLHSAITSRRASTLVSVLSGTRHLE